MYLLFCYMFICFFLCDRMYEFFSAYFCITIFFFFAFSQSCDLLCSPVVLALQAGSPASMMGIGICRW